MTTPDLPPEEAPGQPAPGQQPWPPQQYQPPMSGPPGPPGPPYGPPPYWGPPPPPKPFWQRPAGILLIAFGAVVLLCCAVGQLGRSAGGSDSDTTGDMSVEVTSCEFTGGDLPTGKIGYRVTNNGDSTETARVRIEYRDDSGDRIDTDTAYVRDIAPGDTVRGEESTLLDAPVSSGRCVITGVD